jgi:glycosyltransferase involved in cell wall biosynthesis
MYGGQCAGMYSKSIADLSALCAKYGIPLQLYYLFNESLITRARNYCVDEFMRSDATHLMFIDSDIGFNPQDVIAMLALMTDESPYDVLGGPYPKKCISWEKIKQAVDKGVADENPGQLENYVGDYVFNPKSGQREIPLGEPVEVLELGTGFMMVRRKTFEDYAKAYPHLSYKPDHVRTEHFDGTREIHAYFDCVIDRGYGYENLHQLLADVAAGKEGLQEIAKNMIAGEAHSSKRYLSEDYMFCYNVARMGGRGWLCPWMKLQHVGSYIFGGSLIDLATIGASATADVSKLNKKDKK